MCKYFTADYVIVNVPVNSDRRNTLSVLNCRFDLIFLILDPQDELYDRKLANHLVSLYFHSQEQSEEEFLVRNILSSDSL